MSILSFFKSHTVDSLIADIVQKVEHLHGVADAKHVEQEVHISAAMELSKLATVAQGERDRARSIANKLTALVS